MFLRVPLGDSMVPVNIFPMEGTDADYQALADVLTIRLSVLCTEDPELEADLEIITIEEQLDGWETTLYYRGRDDETSILWIR
ncbi:hypothetical protein [Paenibacillus sp. 1P07SE]|uniref:hypothetical protein n=1 Tax=Paenibacillus sp. 1P07SE TaxID=3132209 RepID=UPI0039A4A70A